MSRLRELLEELRLVFSGSGAGLLDSFLPPIVFLVANSLLGLNLALWGSLVVAGLFAINRIVKRQSLVYALGGLGGVLLAAVFVKVSGSGSGFFLPDILTGATTVVLCVVSVAINRPLVAWTSFIVRRWPLSWYWHPKVLPAYNEVTIAWAVAFAGRLVLQFWLFQKESTSALGVASILFGWPFIILLLIASYLYGLWRLGRLGGPGVEEYKTGQEPPWEGQKRGF
jgi:hypothetical protein